MAAKTQGKARGALHGAERVLAVPDEQVIVCDSRDAADAVADAWRVLAVTWPGQRARWWTADWAPLAGRRVAVLAAATDASRKRAVQIAQRLAEAGCTVRVALPAGSDGADVATWIRDDGKAEAYDVLKRMLRDFEPRATNGQAGEDGQLDTTMLGAYLAHQLEGRWAYTHGRGWFRRENEGLWSSDVGVLALRRRVQRELETDRSQRSIRHLNVVTELQPRLAVAGDRWDASAQLVGLPDGRVLDLHEGARDARADDYVTRRLAAVPDDSGEPAEWLAMLASTFHDHGEAGKITAWLRWWLRYSLSGDCRDESLVFLYGPTGTGKSTLADTWAAVVGEYAATVPGERLVGDYAAHHRQWVARLAGARLVRVGELPERGRWQTADLLAMASGEDLTANHMRQEDFTFQSTLHLLITGNHKPRVSPNSGFWRRLRMIECRHAPARADVGLKERLRAEAGRILAWALAGPVEQPEVPNAIRASADAYREEEDVLADWIAACLVLDEGEFVPSRTLWTSYEEWCRLESIEAVKHRTFSMLLTERFGRPYVQDVDGKKFKCRTGVRIKV